jgi:hypothetical protein
MGPYDVESNIYHRYTFLQFAFIILTLFYRPVIISHTVKPRDNMLKKSQVYIILQFFQR